MKKVGIMTIFRTGNYGATLQAYATQQAINENGFAQAQIINYCCDGVKQKIDRRFLKKAGLFRTLVACMERIYYHPRMRKVLSFVDSFVPGDELTRQELVGLNDQYDIFLSGSDQIWNPQIQQGDLSYLLDFVTDSHKKRSYASSFGVQQIPQEYQQTYKQLLSDYQRITVREEQGVALCAQLLDKPADLVLDPALLLTPAQWEAKLSPSQKKGDYVFAYQMAHSPLIARIVSAASAFCKERAVFVPFPIMGFCKCKPVLNFSSFEWLQAIRDSAFVVTDSFHAAVFSIIFRKPFYYVITSETIKNRLSRLETLLGSLGLQDRLVEDPAQCNFAQQIDYDAVHAKLDRQREHSLKILKELVQ